MPTMIVPAMRGVMTSVMTIETGIMTAMFGAVTSKIGAAVWQRIWFQGSTQTAVNCKPC